MQVCQTDQQDVDMRAGHTFFFSGIGLTLLVGGALAFQTPSGPDVDSSASEMRPLIERFSADRGSLLRTYNLEGSPAQRTRLQQFYTEWRTRLAGLKFDPMSQDGKVDFVLLRRYLDHELQRLDL